MKVFRIRRFPVLAAVAATAVLAVTSVMLSTLDSTAALWQAQSRISPGSISTGNLMVLNGNTTRQSKDFQLSEFSADSLAPGATRQAAVVIKNAGSTPFTVNLSGIRGIANAQGSLLLDQFQLTIRLVNDANGCPTGTAVSSGEILYQGPQGGGAAFTRTPRLALGESLFLCLQGQLPGSASQPGGPANFQLSFGFLAEQSS
ncbi:hypothetical protein ODZ83_03525 [Acaricomes phytoseiuli]|uniref:hypothetical protein n=1 Tax=Acaricomes phytoseiuli TaxID=291968 RepID=UPI0003637F48|nr:hypothetical protein [Acaricomes phytoseiuli]MCW1249269.1 hypothetical protein [Acaricomes phytoseiuli]